jgi:hypothetical protein
MADDESRITFLNVLSEYCYDISIYSSVSEAKAIALGEQLDQTLRSTIPTAIKRESQCTTQPQMRATEASQ